MSKGGDPNIVITPSPEIGSSDISIRELVNMRINDYDSMKKRITISSSGRATELGVKCPQPAHKFEQNACRKYSIPVLCHQLF